MIPYGKQEILQQDIDAVIDVLKSDFLTQGPMVPRFEKTVAGYCCAGYGIAVNSATSALHIACLGLGIEKGDIVWTTPITFVASANCAIYCGADVDFVDIDPKTYNMSATALEQKLVQAKKSGKLPKTVIPVHLCGQSCEMDKIKSLADEYGFSIIEDASHAIGGRYKNKAIGSCEYSDITVFSFHPVKIITTAEGGMALTNNKVLAEKIRLFANHCITRDSDKMTIDPHGPWYYQQIGLGYNFRMTELQAVLGLSQLERLDSVVEQRHQIADRYNKALSDLLLFLPYQSADSYSSYHLYVIRLKLDEISLTHRMVFENMRNAGVGVNLHYIPVYSQPYYKRFEINPDEYPNSESYYQEAISLPMFHHLSNADQDHVINVLKEMLS